MSCIKSLPEVCRLGIARVGIRTLLLVLFTCVMQHTAVLLGNSSTLNKRGENPPRCNRTTPADFSLANSTVYAQTIFSFSAVMAFHEALKTEYDSKTSPCPSHYEQRERGLVKPHCDDGTGKQWYTRPARSQTEGRRTHKHGPRLKRLCPLDQGTWNRLLLLH